VFIVDVKGVAIAPNSPALGRRGQRVTGGFFAPQASWGGPP